MMAGSAQQQQQQPQNQGGMQQNGAMSSWQSADAQTSWTSDDGSSMDDAQQWMPWMVRCMPHNEVIIMIVILPSPSLSERRRYCVARRQSRCHSVCVSTASVSTAIVMRCIRCSLVIIIILLCGRTIVGHIRHLARPSVCLSVPYALVTRKQNKHRKVKIGINVYQGTSKWNADFQLKRSKVKVSGRQKPLQQPMLPSSDRRSE